jgi:hypothetical protein
MPDSNGFPVTKGPTGKPVYSPTHVNDFDPHHERQNPPAPEQGQAPQLDTTREEK